jgi:hypothetical protein
LSAGKRHPCLPFYKVKNYLGDHEFVPFYLADLYGLKVALSDHDMEAIDTLQRGLARDRARRGERDAPPPTQSCA